MTIRINTAELFSLAPKAVSLYRQAFTDAPLVFLDLSPFGVLEQKGRAEHFLAQVLHESGGLRVLVENLNYSAKRLREVWPSRFRTLEEAVVFAHDPRALANRVYGARLGNVEPGDGWKFIGRGLLQLTGRSNYTRIGRVLGLDLVANPDWVLLPEYALRVAGAMWQSAGCNAPADRDAIEDVTLAINGGGIGLEDRRAWLTRVRDANVVTEEP